MEKGTILIIEDDINLSKMYSTKFTMDGFKVVAALNGTDGLKLALSEKIDAILLDMMLPKLHGSEIIKKLHESGVNVPIIVLSNLTSHEEAQKAYVLGVKEYLAKAMFTPEEIVEKVKKYIGS